MKSHIETVTGHLPESVSAKRIDRALADLFPDYSRSVIQQAIKSGAAWVEGVPVTAKMKVAGGEFVELHIPVEVQDERVQPEDIPLDVVYEDDHVIVINKAVDRVMHPAVGNRSGTVQNGLLFRYPELAAIPRSGIVHRLDKDTSGLFVVARTLQAHKSLVEQLQARTMHRQYDAIVMGELVAGATIEAPIGRSSRDRKKMAVMEISGKEAITHYRVQERFRIHTLVRCDLETGRTHQIRVHMAHIHHPLLGDPTYGGRLRLPRGADAPLVESLRQFKRQALHAHTLMFIHPDTGEEVSWSVDMPDDMAQLCRLLRADMRQHSEEIL